MIGSLNGFDTEFYGLDLDSEGNALAVGAISDPQMIADETGKPIQLSYDVSNSKQAPLIVWLPVTTNNSPKYFVFDFGDDRQFIDVAILRDDDNKLRDFREKWNIPTYLPFTSFYFVAMTKSEVCLFLANYAAMSIDLIETFSFEYSINS